MNRFFRILLRVWLAGTLLWAILVLIYIEPRPTFSDVRLLVTEPMPPLSDFLTDPDAQCDVDPTASPAEALFEMLGDRSGRPEIDLGSLTDANRDAAFSAWEAEMVAWGFNRMLDHPPIEAIMCNDGPYVDAILARHADTRPRRAAHARVSGFLVQFLVQFLWLPASALVIGLFLFWYPFRRRT